jgi:hypothetical protein
MRGWKRSGVLRTAATLVVVVLVVGCGAEAAPSPTPTPDRRPTPTPDPHLTEPVAVDDIFRALTAAGLRVVPNNAGSDPSGEPVKRINATLEGWPLILAGYSSSAALLASTGFTNGAPPAAGEPPYTLVGLNILVGYGPSRTAETPGRAEERFKTAAERIVEVLDPLLGPLGQSSSDPVAIPSAD